MYIFTFIMLFTSNWKLTLILISIVPWYTILTVIFGKTNKKLAQNYQDNTAICSIIAEECFSNIRTVKSFGCEYKEIEFFKEKNQEVYIVG